VQSLEFKPQYRMKGERKEGRKEGRKGGRKEGSTSRTIK
jgi:hypothetical protein